MSTNSPYVDTLHQIGEFSFTSNGGTNITDSKTNGKIYVANFFFTACPSVCPKMMNNLRTVQSEFANSNEFLILSHTVTPWIDSVPRLKEYAETMKINTSNWHLLTGDKKDIYSLARYSYFAEEEPGFSKDSSQFLHTEHIILVDQNAHIRGIYNGTNALETERLIEDIELLLEGK
tara:strand:- start:3206 stop:3733 length:528 start_codon:yes stop_codon:yes gene_type:complete